MEELAIDQGMAVFSYSRTRVRELFASHGATTKHAIAEIIAKHVPAFERYLPPPRKLWMSEDSRMSLFDAAALALTFFQESGGDGKGMR